MLLQIVLYIFITIIAAFRYRLSYTFRSIIVLSVPLLLGIAGLLTWGLVGLGIPSLFTFCVLATIFYGSRAGLLASALSVVIIALTWVAVHYGVLLFDIDPAVCMTSAWFWLSGAAFMVLAAGLIGYALGGIHQQTAELVASLDEKNEGQQETNERLRQEMAERIRSEKKRHEMGIKLQQSEKMEFLGTLAGGVAHDLNNVLSGVTGYSDLLLLKDQGRVQLLRYLEAIRDSGKKAAAIVQDFLTLARRGVIVREAVNINDIILQYIGSAECERLKHFHPDLEMELHLEESIMNIMGSPVHISKTIMNLVSNAAEAMPDGGSLIISTRNESLQEPLSGFDDMEPGPYVVICVEDQGTGIAPEDLKKIFEPFYTKKVMGRSGTGLGMSVVWWTVKDHQGFIDIQSTEGKGTVVKLYFPPTRQKPSPKDRPLHIEDYFGKGESILVVDDVEDQRELAQIIFHELGYEVLTASSGEEAIAYLKDNQVDMVFLDMIMDPGMDGLDTLRWILTNNPQQKTIITSGFSETERIEEAEMLGFVKFIKKPYQLEPLAQLVKQMMGET
jgi:signal transduction histidine kinase